MTLPERTPKPLQMPNDRPSKPPIAERGVYVDRGINGAVEIIVRVTGGEDVMHVTVHPAFYDEELVNRLRRWLERADPRLRMVSE